LDFVDYLSDLAKDLPQKAVLMVSGDEHLSVVGQHWAQLEAAYLPSFPQWHELEPILDKMHQIDASTRADVRAPKTEIVSEQTDFAKVDLGWPLVIKGRSGKQFARLFGRQVKLPSTPDEAAAIVATCRGIEVIAQEVIPGEDDQLYTYGSHRSRDGRYWGEFTGRKLRQYPVSFGGAVAAETVIDEQLASAGRALLDELDFYGPSQVEFKLDQRDGHFKLMEVNARLWRWHGLASHCGVDLPYLTYLDAAGFEPPKAVAQTSGRWIYAYFDLPFNAMRVVRRQYPGSVFFKSIRPPFVDAVWAKDDPRPFFRGLRVQLDRGRNGR